MIRTLVFTVFLALASSAAGLAFAQSSDGIMYGGSTDPLGLGAQQQEAAPAAKARTTTGGAVFNRGAAPINLRPRAYVSHGTQADTEQAAQPQQQEGRKATSAAVHNQNLLKAKARESAKAAVSKSPFPPGWGEFNQ